MKCCKKVNKDDVTLKVVFTSSNSIYHSKIVKIAWGNQPLLVY